MNCQKKVRSCSCRTKELKKAIFRTEGLSAQPVHSDPGCCQGPRVPITEAGTAAVTAGSSCHSSMLPNTWNESCQRSASEAQFTPPWSKGVRSQLTGEVHVHALVFTVLDRDYWLEKNIDHRHWPNVWKDLIAYFSKSAKRIQNEYDHISKKNIRMGWWRWGNRGFGCACSSRTVLETTVGVEVRQTNPLGRL